MDTYYHDMSCHAVATENTEGAYSATQYLMEQGHTQIGFIGPIDMTSSYHERWLGYQWALADGGLQVNEGYCLTKSQEVSCTDEEIDAFVGGMSELPTVFFCANDRMAISLLNVLRDRRMKVSEDVSIMGFDDMEMAGLMRPRLTTVRVRHDIMCQKAVELLLSVPENEEGQAKLKISVYGEIVERESVARLNAE